MRDVSVQDGGGWRPLRPPPGATGRPISPFALLSRTHALAMAGDTLVTLALAGSLFFSISPNAARGRVALSLALTMAPFAVVAPLLGPAIDRSSTGRKAMVIGSCAGRALACVAMARVLDGLLIFPAAFALLVLSKSYAVSKSALVPAAVRSDDELVEANSKLAITGVVAGFLASVPGVLLLQLLSAAWTLALAAAVFTAAAVSALGLPATRRPSSDTGRHDRAPALDPPPLPLAGSPARLAAAAVAMALLRAQVGFLTFLVAFGFRHSGAPSWWFGVVLAASMASTLAGSAVAPRLRTWVSEERIIIGALVLVAVTGIGMARVEGRLWAAVVAAGVGLAAGAAKLAFDALVQRDAPPDERGRSFARFEAGFQLVWVIGALLPVLVTTPLRQGYDVLGIAALAAAGAWVVADRRLPAEARPS
jgi:MFS family permease